MARAETRSREGGKQAHYTKVTIKELRKRAKKGMLGQGKKRGVGSKGVSVKEGGLSKASQVPNLQGTLKKSWPQRKYGWRPMTEERGKSDEAGKSW